MTCIPPEARIERLLPAFGLEGERPPVLVSPATSRNATYLLCCRTGRFALKVYAESHLERQLAFEHRVLSELRRHVQFVPRVLPPRQPPLAGGESQVTFLRSNDRLVAVTEWVDDFQFSSSRTQILASGRALGRLFAALDHISVKDPWAGAGCLLGRAQSCPLGFLDLAEFLPRRVAGIGGDVRCWLKELHEAAEELARGLVAHDSAMRGSPQVLVHHDLKPDNIGFSGAGEVIAVRDFEFVKRSHRAVDVASSLMTFCFSGTRLDRRAAELFLSGLHEAYALHPADLELIVPAIVARGLAFLRRLLDRVAQCGVRVREGVFREHLTRIRWARENRASIRDLFRRSHSEHSPPASLDPASDNG